MKICSFCTAPFRRFIKSFNILRLLRLLRHIFKSFAAFAAFAAREYFRKFCKIFKGRKSRKCRKILRLLRLLWHFTAFKTKYRILAMYEKFRIGRKLAHGWTKTLVDTQKYKYKDFNETHFSLHIGIGCGVHQKGVLYFQSLMRKDNP